MSFYLFFQNYILSILSSPDRAMDGSSTTSSDDSDDVPLGLIKALQDQINMKRNKRIRVEVPEEESASDTESFIDDSDNDPNYEPLTPKRKKKLPFI